MFSLPADARRSPRGRSRARPRGSHADDQRAARRRRQPVLGDVSHGARPPAVHAHACAACLADAVATTASSPRPAPQIVADNGLIAYHFGARGNNLNLVQAYVNGVQVRSPWAGTCLVEAATRPTVVYGGATGSALSAAARSAPTTRLPIGAAHSIRPSLASTQIANDGASDWYVDWGGGSNGQVAAWNTIQVIRVTPDLVEWAFTDTQHATLQVRMVCGPAACPLQRPPRAPPPQLVILTPSHPNSPPQHDLHMIMTSDVRGVYMFNIMRAVAATSISEVRFNSRWDRCILNQVYNFERGAGRQPMYAFLDTQDKIQDETWRLTRSTPDPSLPCPADNNGLLPQGFVYTKVRPVEGGCSRLPGGAPCGDGRAWAGGGGAGAHCARGWGPTHAACLLFQLSRPPSSTPVVRLEPVPPREPIFRPLWRGRRQRHRHVADAAGRHHERDERRELRRRPAARRPRGAPGRHHPELHGR